MRHLKEFFKADRLAAYLGIELLEAGNGRAKTRLEIKDHHLNAMNAVHGATIFALADFAFAAACNSHGTAAVAINVSITFIKAARGGVLTAEAVEESANPKLGSYRISITNEQGELIATFQGLAYRKKDALPLPPP